MCSRFCGMFQDGNTALLLGACCYLGWSGGRSHYHSRPLEYLVWRGAAGNANSQVRVAFVLSRRPPNLATPLGERRLLHRLERRPYSSLRRKAETWRRQSTSWNMAQTSTHEITYVAHPGAANPH